VPPSNFFVVRLTGCIWGDLGANTTLHLTNTTLHLPPCRVKFIGGMGGWRTIKTHYAGSAGHIHDMLLLPKTDVHLVRPFAMAIVMLTFGSKCRRL